MTDQFTIQCSSVTVYKIHTGELGIKIYTNNMPPEQVVDKNIELVDYLVYNNLDEHNILQALGDYSIPPTPENKNGK